jgi:hypothetical protein
VETLAIGQRFDLHDLAGHFLHFFADVTSGHVPHAEQRLLSSIHRLECLLEIDQLFGLLVSLNSD